MTLFHDLDNEGTPPPRVLPVTAGLARFEGRGTSSSASPSSSSTSSDDDLPGVSDSLRLLKTTLRCLEGPDDWDPPILRTADLAGGIVICRENGARGGTKGLAVGTERIGMGGGADGGKRIDLAEVVPAPYIRIMVDF